MPAAQPRYAAAAIRSALRKLKLEWARLRHDADRRNEALTVASMPVVIIISGVAAYYCGLWMYGPS